MGTESNLTMAKEIAELIIDKSFWGNEWFALFSFLLVGLVSALFACAGAFFSTRSQNAAIRADFDKALINLEKQTTSVKKIEEGVAHDYIEKREWLKVRREKIEALYLALSSDVDLLTTNLMVITINAGGEVAPYQLSYKLGDERENHNESKKWC